MSRGGADGGGLRGGSDDRLPQPSTAGMAVATPDCLRSALAIVDGRDLLRS